MLLIEILTYFWIIDEIRKGLHGIMEVFNANLFRDLLNTNKE